MANSSNQKPLRGFAAIKAKDPMRMMQIAQMGGKTGAGHRFTSEEAREAVRRRNELRRARLTEDTI